MNESRSRGPNVLLVMADQLAPQHTGTYGHPIIKTPRTNELAERGVRFDATYYHSPLCAPARFTFLSGQPVSATSWDYSPTRDSANEYVRNHMDWFDAGPRSRFPRI